MVRLPHLRANTRDADKGCAVDYWRTQLGSIASGPGGEVKIGILTGGGDVPGLNPCIRSITLSADDLGWEVVGFKRGWQGVLEIDADDPASVEANCGPLTR